VGNNCYLSRLRSGHTQTTNLSVRRNANTLKETAIFRNFGLHSYFAVADRFVGGARDEVPEDDIGPMYEVAITTLS
jgi:hypothetical protein